MSSIILNIGETGSGKNHRSLMLKQSMPNKTVYAIDPAYQYYKADKTIKQIDPTQPISKTITRIVDGLTYIDEAATILNLSGSNTETITALCLCRHNKNVTVLNFHTLRQVPEYIVDYWDIMILGHSSSKAKHAAKFGAKEEEILRAMEVLNRNQHNLHMAINIFKRPRA